MLIPFRLLLGTLKTARIQYKNLYDKILSPQVTEKSTNLSEQNKIVFKVPSAANKKNLKSNIEKIFQVNVTKINIINKQSRTKLTRGRKTKHLGLRDFEVGRHHSYDQNKYKN